MLACNITVMKRTSKKSATMSGNAKCNNCARLPHSLALRVYNMPMAHYGPAVTGFATNLTSSPPVHQYADFSDDGRRKRGYEYV